MRYIYAVIFFLLSLTVSRAQERYSFTHYSSEDGLSQNTVMYIFEDSNGFMWFTTWDGINKFDGYTFKTYKATQDNSVSFENNRVDFIGEDKQGYLWILSPMITERIASIRNGKNSLRYRLHFLKETIILTKLKFWRMAISGC